MSTIKPAVKEFNHTAESGKTYQIKKLSLSETVRLSEVIGNDASNNLISMSFNAMAASVRAIDGIPILFTKTRSDLDKLLDSLEDDFGELALLYKDNFTEVATQEEFEAAVKN